MVRTVIEYMRKKNKISIEDLVLEVCSSTMYYKYIKNEKNLSEKNIILIKDKLGADHLTNPEIVEYKKDLNKIIHKCMRYYSSISEMKKDIEPIIELETQLSLTNELVIDYLIVKLYYLQIKPNTLEIEECLHLLETMKDNMTELQLMNFYQKKLAYAELTSEQQNILLEEYVSYLNASIRNRDYGCFYTNCGLSYIYQKKRMNAFLMFEKAKTLFNRDINFIGLIKTINLQASIYVEQEKYSEALELLLANYETAKKMNSRYEFYYSIVSIIICYSGLEDKDSVQKYFNYLINKLEKDDPTTRNIILAHYGLSLLSTFSCYNFEDEKSLVIKLINDYQVNCDNSLKVLLQYFEITVDEQKAKYIEKILLPNIVGKVCFTYCRWILTTATDYYENHRMYKKATELKDAYMEEFKKFYFY